MCEPPEIKVNFGNMHPGTHCSACLSSDRALTIIGDYIEVYHQIVDSSRTYATSHNTYLCWECVAILKKIHKFKVKAENAHRLLMYQLSNSGTTSLPTLSTLTTIFKDDAFFFAHDDKEPKIKEEIVKLETECDIKIENVDIEIDTERDIEIEHSDEETQDTEKDVTPVKKQYRSRVKRFRYVYNGNVRKKSLLRKKIEIKPNEVEEWIEKEKNSDYYKKLRYKCKSCWYASKCTVRYRNHKVTSHRKAQCPHECHLCKYRFGTESDLNAHVPTHYVGRQCGACGLQCYSVRHFNAHLETHREIQCKECNALFSDLRSFRGHYKNIHTFFICDFCGKKCSAKRILEQHMTHHAPVHPCPQCDKEYRTIRSLRQHQSLAHAPGKHEVAYCVLCDKHFTNIYGYRRHVKDCAAHAHERTVPKKKVPCPLCENTYSKKAYMLNHYRLVHLNTSKHYCSECDKHFLNVTKFKDHMKYKHEGLERPKNKICSTCGRGFASNRVLNNHKLTHSGERPFECEVCGAKFTQKQAMVSHVKHIHLKSKRRSQQQQ